MVAFHFRTNKSFFNWGHQITVPRGQVRYCDLEAEDLSGSLIVIFPRGERGTGRLNHGETRQRGEYYLLSIHGSLPAYFKLHDQLVVKLFKDASSSYAVLEYTN